MSIIITASSYTATHKLFMRRCRDNEKGYKCSYGELKRELANQLDTTVEHMLMKTRTGMYFSFRLNHEVYDVYYMPFA